MPTGDRWLPSPCGADELCLPAACEDCVDECRANSVNLANWFVATTELSSIVVRNRTSLCYSHSCQTETLDGVCGGGECLAVCQAEQKSYLGCEYYAVDLDNANVPCGRDELGNIRYCMQPTANSRWFSQPRSHRNRLWYGDGLSVDLPISEPECGVSRAKRICTGFTIAPEGLSFLVSCTKHRRNDDR